MAYIIFVGIVCECTVSLEVKTFTKTVSSEALTWLHIQVLQIISRMHFPKNTINAPCSVTQFLLKLGKKAVRPTLGSSFHLWKSQVPDSSLIRFPVLADISGEVP